MAFAQAEGNMSSFDGDAMMSKAGKGWAGLWFSGGLTEEGF